MLESSSNTVVYEAAVSLTSLTNNPAAVKGIGLVVVLMVAAGSKFIELAIKESDNNVKLIVLDKVNELHQEHQGILEDLVMEVLRVLSSPDLDVREKVLQIALKMVTSRNVEDVIGLLKKDLTRTIEQDYEKVYPQSQVKVRITSIANSSSMRFMHVLSATRR
jgi:coatomer subunit beta